MLHHYLKSRVKVLTPNGIGVLHSIDKDGNVTVEFENEVLPFFERECKLVLREMNSLVMTESHELGISHLWFPVRNPFRQGELKYSPKDVEILIAHHFDIFNLHEQGLAVYESEIENKH